MATVKAKKPVSKKLKAGKKKKVNKWLILGGVAAVAVIGAVIVRFSSASQWVPIWSSNASLKLGNSNQRESKMTVLIKGHTYRFCVSGYSPGNKATARIQFMIWNLDGNQQRERADSLKAFSTSKTEKHCSKEFRATQSYRSKGRIYVQSGGPTLQTTGASIEYLR